MILESKSVIAKCDNCGAQVEVSDGRSIPDGWSKVVISSPSDNNGEYHLCSECLCVFTSASEVIESPEEEINE